MSRKLHFVSSKYPLPLAGEDQTALCGVVIPQAKSVMRLDFTSGEIDLRGLSTVMFCKVCAALALTPTSEKTYIYGILPGQSVHDEEEGIE